MLRAMRASLVVLALLAACDARATAQDPQLGGGGGEARSREYESCASSVNCQDPLRCSDGVCRRAARSTIGDYQAAAGAAARARGEHDAAIAAYGLALAQYQAEKLEVPPDLDCAYGAALAGGRKKREHAELGARVLHRCVLAVPQGSALREQALAQLVILGEVGLDPAALGPKLADRYLTKAPQKPALDKVTIAFAAIPPTSAKSYAVVAAKLEAAELRPGFLACWDAYTAATKKEGLAAALPLRVAYVRGEYEDDPATWVTKLEAAPGLDGADADADACLRKVVEPALKGTKFVDGFQTKLAITIK